MGQTIKKLILEIIFHSPFKRHVLLKYPYCFDPAQLSYLCDCILKTKELDGSVAEIGCFLGYTSLFLNKFMYAQNIEKKYFALDTFDGFVTEDVKFETLNRAKKRTWYRNSFRENKKSWFDASMKLHKINNVYSIKADVNKYDLTSLGSLSFALLDLDLYRPIKKSLPELYKVLIPGGIIVIDDCIPNENCFDGSYHAYIEFMIEINQKPEIVFNKLGIIKKAR